MHEYHELVFWAAVWVVAFLASLSRSARDADGNGVIRCIGLGSTSGFFALGITCFWCGRGDGAATWSWPALGVAAFVGLLSREQDKYVRSFFAKITKAITEKP